jgi:hypothetical protein
VVAALGSCFDYRAGLTRKIAGSSLPAYVDGAGPSARFASIQSVAWTPAANFLVLVDSGNAIRRIDAMSGETITLAGGLNNGCAVRDGVGSEAQFCRPAYARMAADGSTVWVSSSAGGANGQWRNISVGSGQVPAAPLQCKAATREECRAYASENAPWLLPLAETESCDRPAGCLRAGMGVSTSLIFNTCPNSTNDRSSAFGTAVCADGMVSTWSNQYPSMNYDWSPRRPVVFQRSSTWRFAAGFAGNEKSVTWYRDPQYRRCE